MLKCNENESNLIHKTEVFRDDYILQDRNNQQQH